MNQENLKYIDYVILIGSLKFEIHRNESQVSTLLALDIWY